MVKNLQKYLSRTAVLLTALAFSCGRPQSDECQVLPITGSWVNLAWKDVRNKYTNPTVEDMTDAALWRAKVDEWKAMGLDCLILMEVANEGKAYYPSSIMPLAYPEGEESPVDAILGQAALNGMDVFLSTGWAWDQDDDIRRPEIQARQQAIMEELSALYSGSPAFYGWYLPVEDCITPVFPATAVEAVNRLVDKARALTPEKKTLISPYGMVYADYDDPQFAANIRSLKVDIIAYQDEVGCVREPFPLPRLKEHWKRLREVHEGSGIQMWANCETFTWEGNTNDRTSALIPAAFSRLLAQQIAASEGGVSRIVSFMFQGIIENPESEFPLGQPEESGKIFKDYMSWKGGDAYWKRAEAGLRGALEPGVPVQCLQWPRLTDGAFADMNPEDPAWEVFPPGESSIVLEFLRPERAGRIVLRFLDLARWDVLPSVSVSVADVSGNILGESVFEAPGNNRHDAWIDFVEVPFTSEDALQSVSIGFSSEHKVCIDEIIVL